MKMRNLIKVFLLTSLTLVFSTQKITAQAFWQKLSCGIPDPAVTRFQADTLGGIYALNKDSIYCSKDDGNTWKVMNYDLPIGHLIYLFTNKNGDLYASLNDGLYFLKEGNISWEKISENIEFSPVKSLAVDSRNIIFATNFTWAYRSLDFGKNWKTTPYYNVSLVDIYNDKVYIGGKSPGLARTTDHGESWQQFFLLGGTSIAALGFSSYGDVYAAMSPGASSSYIIVIPDSGKGGKSTGPMRDAKFYSLVGDKNGNVYMVLNPGSNPGYNPIFTSEDRGETWTEISSGLPKAFGYAIGINTNGYLFTCINGFGIYRSSCSVNNKTYVLSPAPDLQYSLYQNYPNPFNPTTTIKYSIAEAGFVNLRIYNAIGKEIITLVDQEKAAGSYEFMFDASKLPSGVYLYRIISGKYYEIKKLTVIK